MYSSPALAFRPAEAGKHTCGRIILEIGVWLKFHCRFHTFLLSPSTQLLIPNIYCKFNFISLIKVLLPNATSDELDFLIAIPVVHMQMS